MYKSDVIMIQNCHLYRKKKLQIKVTCFLIVHVAIHGFLNPNSAQIKQQITGTKHEGTTCLAPFSSHRKTFQGCGGYQKGLQVVQIGKGTMYNFYTFVISGFSLKSIQDSFHVYVTIFIYKLNLCMNSRSRQTTAYKSPINIQWPNTQLPELGNSAASRCECREMDNFKKN